MVKFLNEHHLPTLDAMDKVAETLDREGGIIVASNHVEQVLQATRK
jgi:hypothetical protein